MRAPPSATGGLILSVALPDKPITTDVIDGARGWPKKRCHCSVTCVVGLQRSRVRIICIEAFLLAQEVISMSLEPGVPEGADPGLYQVLVSWIRSLHRPVLEMD